MQNASMYRNEGIANYWRAVYVLADTTNFLS